MRDGKRELSSTAAMLMLFTLFALLSLLQVLYGARVYERVVARMDDGYALRASLCYVTNKLHAHDGEGSATIEDANGLPVLCLWDAAQENVVCIYFQNGALMEQYIAVSAAFIPDAGQTIAELADFTFVQAEKDRFVFTASTWEGTMRRVDVSLRAGGGDAQ